MAKYVVLCLDDLRVALPLSFVERVVRAVSLTPLPDAPDIVLGVVNVGGCIIPAVNMRRRFRLPDRAIALSDQFIIAHTRQRAVALVADAVDGIFEYTALDIAGADTILPGLEYIDGVVRLADGLVLVHNLDRCLSLEEAASLDRAMRSSTGT
jgi:purine-binding chemotaxis protein CheW